MDNSNPVNGWVAMSDYSICLRISGEASNHVESLFHELVKQADDGHRYGVNLEVERIEDPETETSEFQKANE